MSPVPQECDLNRLALNRQETEGRVGMVPCSTIHAGAGA